jgi:hypothetical protein
LNKKAMDTEREHEKRNGNGVRHRGQGRINKKEENTGQKLEGRT